jgi:hypothetical protein
LKKQKFIDTICISAEIRSVPTSNSLLVPEPESQLVPADYAVPELVEVGVGPTPPPPATLYPDRQTGGQKLPDRQKGSVQNYVGSRIKSKRMKEGPKHNIFEHGVFIQNRLVRVGDLGTGPKNYINMVGTLYLNFIGEFFLHCRLVLV